MKTQSFVFLLVLLGISISLQAQWVQLGQDIDGEAAYDNSGRSVSLSGDGSIVAIGAYNNDGTGSSSGHVRVFKEVNGTWEQIGEDIDGEAAGDQSGRSVSLSADGNILSIGADNNDDNGDFSGHVRVFQNIDNTWMQLGNDINGDNISDHLGYSVSLSADGTLLAIGVPYDDNSGNNSGKVKVYQNVNEDWVQLGVDILGVFANDRFGWSVSLSDDGTTVAAGAPYSDENGADAGQVRVFRLIDGDWEQQGEAINGEEEENNFGYSVSLNNDGNTVAVGAIGYSNNGLFFGQVRVYQYIDNTWVQLGQNLDGEAVYDGFGGSVCLNATGTVVAAGAAGNDGNGTSSGHVRVFQLIDTTWIQVGADIDGEAPLDGSGKALALNDDGSIVAIGAAGNADNGPDAGHVRVYQNTYLDVPEFLSEDMHLYPNPTSGILYFEFTGAGQDLKIDVYESLGKTYNINHKISLGSLIELDVSHLPQGLYYIRVQMSENLFTKRLIKE